MPSTIALDLGAGSAVGFVGLTYLYAGRQPLEVEIGLGQGYTGIQASIMAKLSFGTSAHRFATGIGISDTIAARTARVSSGYPVWVNLDLVGYEYRRSRFFFGLALGMTAGLGGGNVCIYDGECQITNSTSTVKDVSYPQGRLMTGVSF